MRMLFCVISIVIFAFPGLSPAYDILVVQDQRSHIYDTLMHGFENGRHFKERVIVLQDFAENDLVKIVREDHPALVLAVGGRALAETRMIRQTPVVSVFAYAITMSNPPPNLAQVKMLAPVERFAALFHALGAKRVGTVLSASASSYAARASEIFRKAGIHLVVREAGKPGDITKQLESLKNTADALWLLPDPAIVTSETVEAFALYSLRHQLPLVSFSDAHLKKGATAAFAIDLEDLGKQAAETVGRIVAGDSPEDIQEIPPRKVRLRFNRQVMEHLGLPVTPLQHLGGSEAD
jgi:putative tryptophan/tyrosine transport system substrate-binding protein